MKKIYLIIIISIIISNFSFSNNLKEIKADTNATLDEQIYLENIIKAENFIDRIFEINEPFYSEIDSRNDGILKINEIRKTNLYNYFSNKITNNLFINLNKELYENEKIFAYSNAESLNTNKFKNIYDTDKFKGNNLNDGEYRYSGINFLGERVVNPDYPYDTDGVYGIEGRQLNDKNWIEAPWDKKIVRDVCPDVTATRFDFLTVKENNSKLVKPLMDEFMLSMEKEHGLYFDEKYTDREKWINYIHVTTPYSDVSRGIARLWHSAGETLWYVDVTLNDNIEEINNTEITIEHKRYRDDLILQEETMLLSEIKENISKLELTNYKYIGSQIKYNNETKQFKIESADKRETYITSEIDNTKDEITIEFYYKENQKIEEIIGILKAMERKAEKFDVEQAIPTSEYLYANIKGKNHITNYKFINETGKTSYEITVKRKYIEKWIEEGTIKTSEKTVKREYTIEREYSYYEIEQFESYKIEKAKIKNEILENGEITLNPQNYNAPEIEIKNNTNIIKTPEYDSVITLATKEIEKGETIDTTNWKEYAEEAVGEYQIKNDKLIFNNEIIMNGEIYTANAPSPLEIPEAEITGENVLYEDNIKINEEIRNGEYQTIGEIIYKRIIAINPINEEIIKKEVKTNDVKIHTPIYTELLISTKGDKYNQNINGEIEDRAVILGMSTMIRYSTNGQHKNILGYGNRDYDKYIKKKEIKFPFDVYYNTEEKENDKYIEANAWIEVIKKDTDIYVPIWVDEGTYKIETRTTAINAKEEDKIITTEANINEEEYIIKDEKEIKIIGRLFGLKITDITDYPTWEEVFRKEKGSYEHIEGNYYPVGGNNENGIEIKTDKKYFLPIIPGSHPTYENIGSIKTGYEIRYQIETIGNNYNEEDKIIIMPTFKYVDKEGKINTEINLWSYITDKENNNYLINLNDIKEEIRNKIKYVIEVGDPYREIKEEEYEETSKLLGITKYELKNKQIDIGYADKIELSKYLRIYNGNNENIPEGVDKEKSKKSKQKWYGEYKLPNNTYVVDKEIDLNKYAMENNGLDFNEEIFKKDGYILVNFKIETEKDVLSKGEVLKYNAPLSNMFEIEGFNKTKECNVDGITKEFNFEYGDIIFFNPNKKRSEDYNSYGTH